MNADGGRATPFAADLSRPEEIDALFESVRGRVGRLDVLVNNAVFQMPACDFADTPRAAVAEAFAVNALAPFYLSQHAARMMRDRGGGSIIHVGSNVAGRAIRRRSAYIATKGAVAALTRAMAVDLGPDGIRVNSVVPGYIRTERWDALPAADVARRRDNLPLRHEAEQADVAAAVLFLASDAARRIHGVELPVDGGILAQLVPADCDV